MARPTRIDAAAMLGKLPIGRDAAAVRRRIEAVEHIMERLLPIPGTSKRVGLDVVLDLLPVAGPTVGAGIGAWLAWEASNLGMPKRQMARMAGNVGFDWLLGLIPWVGAIPDYFFKSNTRNLRLVKRHLDKHHPATALIDQPVR